MEYMIIGENWMSCNTIQKRLEHAFPPCNQSRVFLGLGLLDRVIADCLLGRYWRDNERRVQLDEIET
jgi:hypothetical protein